MTSLLISINWKKEAYDSILVIVNQLTKIDPYKLVKITIDGARLAKVIIDVVVKYPSLLDSIVSHRDFLFNSKSGSWVYYFLYIKRKLFTSFHPQTDYQTKR